MLHELLWGTRVFSQVASASAASVDCLVLDLTLSDVDTPEDISVFEAATGCSRLELTNPTVSVVIPTLNEEKRIVSAIRRTVDAAVGCTLGKLVQAREQLVTSNDDGWNSKFLGDCQ